MGDRLIIAPADKVSGLDFFDAITGSSPERRKERDQELREQCIRAIESGDTYGYPPLLVAECREIIAKREAPPEDRLTEVHSDPFKDLAA